jgi:hypothetical protein
VGLDEVGVDEVSLDEVGGPQIIIIYLFFDPPNVQEGRVRRDGQPVLEALGAVRRGLQFNFF